MILNSYDSCSVAVLVQETVTPGPDTHASVCVIETSVTNGAPTPTVIVFVVDTPAAFVPVRENVVSAVSFADNPDPAPLPFTIVAELNHPLGEDEKDTPLDTVHERVVLFAVSTVRGFAFNVTEGAHVICLVPVS